MKARRRSHKLSRDYKISRLVNPIAKQEPEEPTFNVKLQQLGEFGWHDMGCAMPQCTEEQIKWLNVISRDYYRIIKVDNPSLKAYDLF